MLAQIISTHCSLPLSIQSPCLISPPTYLHCVLSPSMFTDTHLLFAVNNYPRARLIHSITLSLTNPTPTQNQKIKNLKNKCLLKFKLKEIVAFVQAHMVSYVASPFTFLKNELYFIWLYWLYFLCLGIKHSQILIIFDYTARLQ